MGVKYPVWFEDLKWREKRSTEVGDSILTRKAAIEYEGTRTANRHR